MSIIIYICQNDTHPSILPVSSNQNTLTSQAMTMKNLRWQLPRNIDILSTSTSMLKIVSWMEFNNFAFSCYECLTVRGIFYPLHSVRTSVCRSVGNPRMWTCLELLRRSANKRRNLCKATFHNTVFDRRGKHMFDERSYLLRHFGTVSNVLIICQVRTYCAAEEFIQSEPFFMVLLTNRN